MKPLEEHLAEFLLHLHRGPDIGSYCRRCFAMWEQKYGKLVAVKAEKIVRERWKDKKGKMV